MSHNIPGSRGQKRFAIRFWTPKLRGYIRRPRAWLRASYLLHRDWFAVEQAAERFIELRDLEWELQNERRCYLIREHLRRGGLTLAEKRELARLQAALRGRLRTWDERLLKQMAQMEAEYVRSSSGPDRGAGGLG